MSPQLAVKAMIAIVLIGLAVPLAIAASRPAPAVPTMTPASGLEFVRIEGGPAVGEPDRYAHGPARG